VNEPKVATQQEIPPWLFAPLAAVHGIAYWGVCALVIPYLLRKHGVAVDRIAGVVATASIPTFCYFLWAPIIDLGLRRRTWILLCSGAVALCSTLAVAGSAGSLTWVTIFLTASNAIGSVGSAAIGALMAAQPAAIRGRASGWFQAGNVGLGSLGGGAFIWLADRMGLPALSCAVAAAVFLPALAAYRVTEPPPPSAACSATVFRTGA
jgi:MFS family permease